MDHFLSSNLLMLISFSAKELAREGREIHHCVGSYVQTCQRGNSAIWSVSAWSNKNPVPECVTVEMEFGTKRLVQVRGSWNSNPSNFMLNCVQRWKIHGMREAKYKPEPIVAKVEVTEDSDNAVIVQG